MVTMNEGTQAGSPQTANDRFKEGASSWFWGSVTVAAILHLLLFSFLPPLEGSVSPITDNRIEVVQPPEAKIPPPPDRIVRPATPLMAEADIDKDITIPPTTFPENPVEDLPAPPRSSRDLIDTPMLTPVDINPVLKNPEDVKRALMRAYPPFLRDAGVGGTVTVWFFIDEEGLVQNAEVFESSGRQGLDDAALDLAMSGVYRFSPALNRDQAVPVWVSIAIQFESH